MSKIICDICGTSYPETEERCPICGCARDFKLDGYVDELMEDGANQETAVQGQQMAAAAAGNVSDAEDLFDDDIYSDSYEDDVTDEDDFEDDDDYDDDEDDDEDDDDDDDDDDHKSNAPLVILLVIVILALIAVSGFIFVKYFMPNVLPQETTQAPLSTTAAPVETTELRIPCENLALTSGGDVVLGGEGANWLINVLALPDNTTDKLVYTSSDETVVVVDEQGKVTAVGEGTAVIIITCGDQELRCTVTCDFTPETTAPSEPEETTSPSEPQETTEPTEPEETTKPTEPLKDIDLKSALSYTELTFNGPNQGVTITINGLKNTEVQWSSEDETVATVDENGRILNTGKGTTYIVVRYGDQEVKIRIVSKW